MKTLSTNSLDRRLLRPIISNIGGMTYHMVGFLIAPTNESQEGYRGSLRRSKKGEL